MHFDSVEKELRNVQVSTLNLLSPVAWRVGIVVDDPPNYGSNEG